MVDIQVLQQREDGSRICGMGVPLSPVGSAGALTNMSKLIALLDTQLEDLLTFTTGTPGVNEVQLVTITGGPTSGTFILTLLGNPTTALPPNATAAQMQTALVALPGVSAGDVAVTLVGTVYSVLFLNNLGNQNIAQMTVTNTFNKGTVAVSTQTPGAAPGAGITAESTVDSTGGLLITLADATGGKWTYRVFPAINLGSTMITFLGELASGNPNAWAPIGVQAYPPTELEWREATVRFQAPVGEPDPRYIEAMRVKD